MSMSATPFYQQSMNERRRRDIDRINDMTAKDTTVTGRQLLIGPGEAIFDVVFPVSFAHLPNVTFGCELDTGLSPVHKLYPGVQACVIGWNITGKIDGSFDGFYIGASISALVYGDDAVRLWCHWCFRGTGLRNPIKPTDLLEDTL